METALHPNGTAIKVVNGHAHVVKETTSKKSEPEAYTKANVESIVEENNRFKALFAVFQRSLDYYNADYTNNPPLQVTESTIMKLVDLLMTVTKFQKNMDMPGLTEDLFALLKSNITKISQNTKTMPSGEETIEGEDHEYGFPVSEEVVIHALNTNNMMWTVETLLRFIAELKEDVDRLNWLNAKYLLGMK